MTSSNASTVPLAGRDVARIGYGAMQLTHGGHVATEAATDILRLAAESGANHFDTAFFYGAGACNELIRAALAPYQDGGGLVVATKVGADNAADGGLVPAQRPAELRRQVEANLASLGVDRLDLVYLRVGTMEPPHGESVAAQFEALAAMREEGLIRHLGLSNVDIGHLAEALTIAPVAAVQNHFHAGKRDDAELLAVCEAADIAFVPFFPLGGGRDDLAADRMAKVAEQHGATVPQIALAWLLASSHVTLAIPGTGSLTHLKENMAAASIILTPEDLSDLA